MEDVEEGRGSGGLEGDPLLRVRVRTPGLRSVILACAAVVTVVFITATTGEAMGGGARTVLAAEASWDPSNESWYVQYMVRRMHPLVNIPHPLNGQFEWHRLALQSQILLFSPQSPT